MTLPDNFSPAEHLQSTVRRYYNHVVRDWFRDLGGDDWPRDISTPRASLRTACTHLDEDSLILTHTRALLFDHITRAVSGGAAIAEAASAKGIYRKHKPKVTLFFQQDTAELTEPSQAPVTGQISFRLMKHTNESYTPALADALARDIRSEFAIGDGYVWRKGKLMVSYTHWEAGYQLQLLCRSDTIGRELIGKVLSLQNDTPQWEFCNVSQNQNESAAYPNLPGNEFIFGESRRLPRRRPLVDVRFQYATLNLAGVPNPIPLIDLTGTWSNPILSA